MVEWWHLTLNVDTDEESPTTIHEDLRPEWFKLSEDDKISHHVGAECITVQQLIEALEQLPSNWTLMPRDGREDMPGLNIFLNFYTRKVLFAPD